MLTKQAENEAAAKQEQEDKDNNLIEVQRDYIGDERKKNYSKVLVCNRCRNTFAGNRRRKECFSCSGIQTLNRQRREQEQRDKPPSPYPERPRKQKQKW